MPSPIEEFWADRESGGFFEEELFAKALASLELPTVPIPRYDPPPDTDPEARFKAWLAPRPTNPATPADPTAEAPSRDAVQAARSYVQSQRALRKNPAVLTNESARYIAEQFAQGRTRIPLPAGTPVAGLEQALAALGVTESFMIGVSTGTTLDAKRRYSADADLAYHKGGPVVVFGGGAA